MGMDPTTLLALSAGLTAAVVAALALRKASRAESALETERLERLSSAEAAEAAARLVAGRIDAVERRVGRGIRLTAAKRDRALQLLAHGAAEAVIARELELRQAEVSALARLRNQGGISSGFNSSAA